MLSLISVLSFMYYQPSLAFKNAVYNSLRNKNCMRMVSQHSQGTTDIKRIVFLGTPVVAANVLTQICKEASNRKFIISAVVTQPPSPSGRKKAIQKSPVHDVAEKLSIPVLYPEKATDTKFLDDLEDMKPDLCITAAYGNYLPKRFLAIPKYGTINIHPSLLPLYRGASPLQRCLENGDEVTGVTVLTTVTKMDAGPILSQTQLKLNGDEKSTELLGKLFHIGAENLLDLLPKVFDESMIVTEQNHDKATEAPKINSMESKVDFGINCATTVHNKVRAFSDWPGVWTTFQIENEVREVVRVKLITTTIISNKTLTNDKMIRLVKHEKFGHYLEVACHDGSMLGILELQPISKKVMKARDFVNGLRGTNVTWITPSIDSLSE